MLEPVRLKDANEQAKGKLGEELRGAQKEIETNKES